MDSHTGALAWLAQGAASNLLDRLVDRVLDGPAAPPAWPRPAKTPAGTVEISVRHHLAAKGRTPVILTLQEDGSRTGTAFAVVLGNTARIALPGGRYFGAAMVVDPARRTLQGIGWSRLTVTARRTSPCLIPANRPSAPMMLQLGCGRRTGRRCSGFDRISGINSRRSSVCHDSTRPRRGAEVPEPITMSLIWLGQAAGAAIVGRLAERGMDRLLDGPRQVVLPPVPPRVEPRRHRLGDVTSDLDITVRHTPAGRRPVLLAFQTAPRDGERTPGVTVPMVLGETAHLSLPRDDYLISALVLDPPGEFGGKAVLHGVGWVRHWAASSGTDRLTITTEAPTTQLLRKLGLQAPDGTSPFELPPPGIAAPRQFTSAPTAAQLAAANAVNRFKAADRHQCRAATLSRFGPRCTFFAVAVGGNGLCVTHSLALTRGRPVYEWSTRQQIT